MKTIAITGATGQFGSIALDLLKAKHANVIALVRSPEKILGAEAHQSSSLNKKLEWRKERWQKALKEENVRTTLIH